MDRLLRALHPAAVNNASVSQYRVTERGKDTAAPAFGHDLRASVSHQTGLPSPFHKAQKRAEIAAPLRNERRIGFPAQRGQQPQGTEKVVGRGLPEGAQRLFDPTVVDRLLKSRFLAFFVKYTVLEI